MTADSRTGPPAAADELTRELQEANFRLDQQLVQMAALYQAGLSLSASLGERELTEQLLPLAVSMVDARCGFLLLRGPDGRKMRLAGRTNLSEADEARLIDKGLRDRLGRARRKGVPLVLGPAQLPSGFPGKHAVIVPTGDRGFIGVIDKETREGVTCFDEVDVNLLEMMSRQAGLALSNAQLFDGVVAERNLNVSIFDSAANGILSTDLQGRIVRANPAGLRALGTDRAAATGKSCVALLRSRGCRRLAAAVGETLADGEPREIHQEAMAEGGVTLNGRVTSLVSRDGQVTGAVLTIEDLTEQIRLKTMFRQYASDQVVEMLLRDGRAPALGGEMCEATTVFVDTVGSTELLGKIGAPEMVALMNECYTRLVDLVFKYSGTLDKYTGDGFMAVFGAPLSQADDTQRAVLCSLEIADEMERFNRGRSQPLDIKIGISRGPVVAGNLGSPRRMEYSVIGRDVNLASRLCDHAYAGEILVSSAVRREVAGDFSFEPMGRHIFKGMPEPLDVFRVLGPGEAAAELPGRAARQSERTQVVVEVPMVPDMELVVSRTADAVGGFVGLGAEKCDEVKSALVEACINAFEHSRSKDQRLRVDFLTTPEELIVVVSDRGHGFDAVAAAERLRQRREAGDQRRGWGLELIEQFMDSVDIESGPEGTTLTLMKRR